MLTETRRDPALRDGLRIYVVGDIHGQLVCLMGVIDAIIADIDARPTEDVLTVFIGDYIDKGLASKSVVETIIREDRIGAKVTLRGNHEEMMLLALNDVACMQEWCAVGGVPTIFSYGVDVRDLMVGRGYDVAQVALADALPERHLAWLTAQSNRYECDDYFFCHAGINPDIPMDRQDSADLLWIRSKFTQDERTRTKIIVHGHSPSDGLR